MCSTGSFLSKLNGLEQGKLYIIEFMDHFVAKHSVMGRDILILVGIFCESSKDYVFFSFLRQRGTRYRCLEHFAVLRKDILRYTEIQLKMKVS